MLHRSDRSEFPIVYFQLGRKLVQNYYSHRLPWMIIMCVLQCLGNIYHPSSSCENVSRRYFTNRICPASLHLSSPAALVRSTRIGLLVVRNRAHKCRFYLSAVNRPRNVLPQRVFFSPKTGKSLPLFQYHE